MECFRCEAEGESFERVAVDRSSGGLLGTVCEVCEGELVPDAPDFVVFMGTCLHCGGTSDVVFPQWDALVENGDGDVEVEYTVRLVSPAICRECAKRPDEIIEQAELVDESVTTS